MEAQSVLAVWENRSHTSLLPPDLAARGLFLHNFLNFLIFFCIIFTEKPNLTHLGSFYVNPCSLSFWGRLRFASHFLIKTQILGWRGWELEKENLGQAWAASLLCVKSSIPDRANPSWRSWERFEMCSAHSRIRPIVHVITLNLTSPSSFLLSIQSFHMKGARALFFSLSSFPVLAFLVFSQLTVQGYVAPLPEVSGERQ